MLMDPQLLDSGPMVGFMSTTLQGVPKAYEVELRDCETGEVIDMREVKSYEVEIDKVRKFELRVGM